MDEHTFISMCDAAGLKLRCVMATRAASKLGKEAIFDAFYLVEKI
jgi:hypothetical protein